MDPEDGKKKRSSASPKGKPKEGRKMMSKDILAANPDLMDSRAVGGEPSRKRQRGGDDEEDEDASVFEKTALEGFKVATHGTLHQREAVTESVLEPFVFADQTNVFLVFYKQVHTTMTFRVTENAVEVDVNTEVPTEAMVAELSKEIVVGDVEPIIKSMAVSLGDIRVWPNSATKIDSPTWIGVKMSLNKTGKAVVIL